jgi:uncharacterized membrane protein
MTFTGHFHPLLVHFPIGLILIAALAELVAMGTGIREWRVVAVANVRAGALFAFAAALSGWLLSVSTVVDDVPSLEWHRWIGATAAVATLGAALTAGSAERGSTRARWIYRFALFGAAALVGIAAHLGGRLVWGSDFLRP